MVCQIHATRRLRTPDLSLPPTPPSVFGVPLDGQHVLHPVCERRGDCAHNLGCQLLVSHFEAPVFPPTLLYTTEVPHGGVNTQI